MHLPFPPVAIPFSLLHNHTTLTPLVSLSLTHSYIKTYKGEKVDFEYEREKDIVPRLRELLRFRDGAVEAERKQVQLLQAKNEALRASVDQVRYHSLPLMIHTFSSSRIDLYPTLSPYVSQAEAEVGSLQEALSEANEKLRVGVKEKKRLDRRIAALDLALGTVKGQEYAIDLAGKQNM